MTFLANVFASITAAVIMIVFTSAISKNARWVIFSLLGRLINSDLEYVYRNKEQGQDDMVQDINDSDEVYIITSRGNEFQRGTFKNLLDSTSSKNTSVKIILPDINIAPNEIDWIIQRENEIKGFEKPFGNGILKNQIETSIKLLKLYATHGNVSIRTFNFPHFGRYILTNRYLYYTPYTSSKHGRDNKVYKFRRGGEMYDSAKRLFDMYWNNAKNI